MLLICSLLLEVIFGTALTSLLVRLPRRNAGFVFVLSLGTIVGICSMGLLYGLVSFFVPSAYDTKIFIEIFLTAILAFAAYKKHGFIWKKISLPARIRVADLVLICGCALYLGLFLKYLCLSEHGMWDAWRMWNAKARTLAATGGNMEMTLLLKPYAHSDYPLLLSFIHARHFQMAGSLSTLVPRITAFLFYVASVGLFVSFISIVKNNLTGRVALVAICLLIYLPVLYIAQYADGYIATLLLALLAVAWFTVEMPVSGNCRVSPILCGILVGALIMTKNEGLLLTISFIVGYVAYSVRKSRMNVMLQVWAKILLGACVFLILYCAIKWYYPVKNDLVSLDMHDRLMQLSDVTRYRIIFVHFFKEIFNWYWLLLPVIIWFLPYRFGISGVCRKKSVCMILLPLIIALSGYMIIYFITPYSLEWHLRTSFDRVLCHLMPSLLLFVFIISNPVNKKSIK
jgi:hypothetical protein